MHSYFLLIIIFFPKTHPEEKHSTVSMTTDLYVKKTIKYFLRRFGNFLLFLRILWESQQNFLFAFDRDESIYFLKFAVFFGNCSFFFVVVKPGISKNFLKKNFSYAEREKLSDPMFSPPFVEIMGYEKKNFEKLDLMASRLHRSVQFLNFRKGFARKRAQTIFKY